VVAGNHNGRARQRAVGRPLGTFAALALAAAAILLVLRGAEAEAASEASQQRAQLAGAAPLAEGSSKVGRSAVRRLRKASCPADYLVRVQRQYDPEEIAAARRGQFHFGGADVKVKTPFDWTTDPVGSASFRARLHDLRWLDVLLYDYRTNGRVKSLRQAKRIAVDWVKQNPRRNPSTDRTWFDKVVGDRAAYLAYVTRAAQCERIINGKLARRMLSSLVTHGSFLKDGDGYTDTNRGLFMDLGLLQIGKQVRFLQDAGTWRKRGEKRFARNVKGNTFKSEGFWLEHSTTYQFLTIGAIERYLDIPGIKNGDVKGRLKSMSATAGWLVLPDKRWLQAGNSYQDKANKLGRESAKDAAGLRLLRRSGLGFVRKGDHYLSVLADFHSSTHKHSDELSFDLYDRDRRIVSDSGMYSKDPSPYLDFQQSAEAHSTIVVDRRDFSRDAADAYGSGITAGGQGDGWYALEATNPLLAPQGVSHDRLYLYKPGTALLIADRLRSDQNHDYRRHLQLGQGLKLKAHPDRLELSKSSEPVATIFTASTDPDEDRRYVKGEEDPQQGLIFPDFRDRDKRWTAFFDSSGSDLDALTTISLKPNKLPRGSLESPLDANPVRIGVSQEGAPAYTLVVTRSDGQLSVVEEPATAG
jgi:hypothetical protein